MTGLSFEQSLQIRKISEDDVFESIEPSWTWPGGTVVPGGVLMAFAAAAAYETLGDDWSIDHLNSHFLLGPDARVPLQMHVKKLSDGGRFAVRAVEVKQKGKGVCFVSCSFVRAKLLHGPSMQHAVQRKTDFHVDSIALDDLAPTPAEAEKGKTRWMQFQRLGVQKTSSSSSTAPEDLTYTSVGSVRKMNTSSRKLHALALLSLSDYHLLDGPPHLHNISSGQAPIGTHPRETPLFNDLKQFTSLTHTVHFHLHDGFRADELCYVEVESPWTGGRRGYVRSGMFDSKGGLVATCVQGAYYVLKEGVVAGKGKGEGKEKEARGSKI